MLTALSINKGGLGRMGNQMFTIAGVIGIAVRSGQLYGFPEWLTKDNEIFGQQVDNINDHLLNPLPGIPEGMTFDDWGYFWGYRDIVVPYGNYTIDAHMQCFKFFEHCLPLIQETFRFKDEPEQNDYVAIHFRAGDYIDDATAQHPRCSTEYYLQAIALFPPDTKFMLFSDDLSAIDKLRHNGDLFVRIEPIAGGNYISDFKLMKRCKSFICANSSFSFMAALLGEHPDKKIIMPKIWFGSSMPPEFETKDIYPENAIVI